MSITEAVLAYGYDLGTAEGFLVNEVDDGGALTASWFDMEVVDEFPEQVYQRLYAAIPGAPAADADEYERTAQSHFGVKIAFAGTFDAPRYILAVVASESTAYHDDACVLDLDRMRGLPESRGWETQLAVVLATLDLTPLQTQPKWLIFPFCD